MSFKENPVNNQLSLTDRAIYLTQRERNGLVKSWPEIFANDIFHNINEKPFSVLYSDKDSRPNTPVNIIVGLLMLKEVFNLSDDEVVESMIYDIRFQYALHTTSYSEQPISDKTLSRFRRRCYDYEAKTGIDLTHECTEEMGADIAKKMGISGQTKRMDSMMIETNIRKLSRIELIYCCVSRLARYFYNNTIMSYRRSFFIIQTKLISIRPSIIGAAVRLTRVWNNSLQTRTNCWRCAKRTN